MKKTDLDTIRKQYGLKNVSHLNKAELVDRLEVLVPALFPLMLEQIGQTQYDLLCILTDRSKLERPIEIDSHCVDVLEQYGIAFSADLDGNECMYVPEELAAVFCKADGEGLRQIVRRNTEWVDLTHGMLHYYGVLDAWKLKSKLEELTGQFVPFVEMLPALQFACVYHQQMALSPDGFHDIRVVDAKEVLREHKRRLNTLLYPFDRKQLLAAALPEYVDRTPEMRRFLEFITTHFRFTEEKLNTFAKELHDAMQAGNQVSSLMKTLQEWIRFPSEAFVNDLMSRFMPLYNSTRQWALKGYAPVELSAEERKHLNPLRFPVEMPASASGVTLPFPADENPIHAASSKVGRNEPCPCGSGKKYKKCCLPASGK